VQVIGVSLQEHTIVKLGGLLKHRIERSETIDILTREELEVWQDLNENQVSIHVRLHQAHANDSPHSSTRATFSIDHSSAPAQARWKAKENRLRMTF
jgi:metal-responsive CopG/Arc/MetJ family transcriptional regulator